MSRRKLSIDIKGATEAEIRRGIAAAQAVFDNAGVTPWAAAVTRFQRDGLDESGVLSWEYEIARLKQVGADAAAVATQEAELASFLNENGLRPSTKVDHSIADLWDEANVAAAKACCAGWTNPPERAGLAYLPETDATDR